MSAVKTLEYQVNSITKKGATARAGFGIPIKSNIADGGKTGITGKFSYGCQFTFSPDGYVSGSVESMTYSTKSTIKSANAAGGRRQYVPPSSKTYSMKQQFALKKRIPKKPRKPRKPLKK